MSSPNPGKRKSGKSASFTEFARALADPVPCVGNQPLHLDDAGVAWLVESGAVDIFTAEYQQDGAVSFFKHILRAQQGRMLFGADRDAGSPGLGLIAKGLPGSSVRPVPLRTVPDKLAERVIRSVLVTQVDAWISEFSEAVARDIEPQPQLDCLLTSDEASRAVGVLSSAQGVRWIDGRKAEAAFLGMEEPEPEESGLMPISPGSWVTLMQPATVSGCFSRDLPAEDLLLRRLPEFHRLALDSEAFNRKLLLADDANLQRSRSAYRRQDQLSARDSLFNVVGKRPSSASDDESALLSALHLVGRHEGIAFQAPRHKSTSEPSLERIFDASGVRARRIRLSATERWWQGDSGAMLAFRRDNQQPVALIPGMLGRYRCIDPASGASVKMNAKTAAALEETAWLVYRPLPDDRPAGARDLWQIASRKMLPDLLQVTLAGLCMGLAMLIPPVAIGILADRIIPTGNFGQLLHLSGLLVGVALLVLLLSMLRGTAMMRLEGRAAARIIAATWDRLLGLSARFFARFTAGELAARAMVFQMLRDQFSGIAANAILSALFLLPTFALVFVYNSALGWMCLGFGLLALGLTISLGLLQIKYHRRELGALRKLSGHLFQLINGVGKLRATGAEASAYAFWARQYRNRKLAEVGISKLNEHLLAFGAAVPALAGAAGKLVWQDYRPHVPARLLVRRADDFGVFLQDGDKAAFHHIPEARQGNPAPVALPLDTLLITAGHHGLQDEQPVRIDR